MAAQIAEQKCRNTLHSNCFDKIKFTRPDKEAFLSATAPLSPLSFDKSLSKKKVVSDLHQQKIAKCYVTCFHVPAALTPDIIFF